MSQPPAGSFHVGTAWSSVFLAILLSILVAAPTLGAKPSREVIDIGTPADEAADAAFISELCGFPITVDTEATVTVHIFTSGQGEFTREIDKYIIRETFTNPATGESVTLHDVGPDIVWINRDGEVMLAQIGRSLTGSGYIGRVVTNLDTGETVLVAGKNAGTLEEQICVPLSA
jgi:hypothetical protein